MSHHHKKRFGQNFLVNNLIIDKILQVLSIQNHDTWIEIGPGLGALTQPLLQQVSKLIAIEIDRTLIAKLMQLPLAAEKLSIFNTDALTVNYQQWHTNIRLVGNLPYNIATTLLFHLLQFVDTIQDMHFMLQKEVAERLVGKCSTKAYGRLSVMVGYVSQVALLSLIPPTAFHPSPKVTSAFVRIVPYTTLPFVASDFSLFSKIVQQAFNQRRKTLKNSLHAIVTPAHFEKAEIDSQLRAENLDVEGFVKLTNICSQDSF